MEQQTFQPLHVGVIGLGWSGETHIKAYLQQPNVAVQALAGLEADRLAALGKTYNIPHLYPDYQELIARDDLDAVSVCLPNFLHAPVSIAALKRGKHVLCEKPLARTAAEAETIVQAAAAAGRVLQVVFNQRARGEIQVLKRYIEAGNLGRIYHVKASWIRRSGIPGLESWFTKRAMSGGGPLIDIGVHMLDLVLYLLNEPEVTTINAATYAELGPRGRGSGSTTKMFVGSGYEVEDFATTFLRLADGTTVQLDVSWAVYGSERFDMALFGTEGGAEIKRRPNSWEALLQIYTDVAGVASEIHPHVTRGEGHVAVVRNFVEAIRSGDWSAHIDREGLRRNRIIDACYTSALEGREITLQATEQEL